MRIDMVLDGVGLGIITTDIDGNVVLINRSAAELLEINPTITGVPIILLLGLAESPAQILGTEARRSLSHRVRTPSGVALDLELTFSGGEGPIAHFVILRDVREEKRRDAEHQRFERLAAMGTMVAGFAHEVRNPVAAMRSIAEELEEELRDANMSMPHVGLLLQMVERIERLVRTSLQFGRPPAPKRTRLHPGLIVSTALTELHPRWRSHEEKLGVALDPDLPDVHVDERQLAQALVILLQNALDATGAPSRVFIRVRKQPSDKTVRFEVIDDGPGIPTEILGRIFDPFFTTKPAGTGLGLSIAQQIVSENGARLEVASGTLGGGGGGLGGGASFSIIVPS